MGRGKGGGEGGDSPQESVVVKFWPLFLSSRQSLLYHTSVRGVRFVLGVAGQSTRTSTCYASSTFLSLLFYE